MVEKKELNLTRGESSKARDEVFKSLSKMAFLYMGRVESGKSTVSYGNLQSDNVLDMFDYCYRVANLSVGRGDLCEPLMVVISSVIRLALVGDFEGLNYAAELYKQFTETKLSEEKGGD